MKSIPAMFYSKRPIRMTALTDTRIMARLTSSFVKIIMKPLSAMRILKGCRRYLLKELQKKATASIHQGIRTVIHFQERLYVENVVRPLSEEPIISQAEIILPGLADNISKTGMPAQCFMLKNRQSKVPLQQ